MRNVNFVRNNFGALLMTCYPIYLVKKIIKFESIYVPYPADISGLKSSALIRHYHACGSFYCAGRSCLNRLQRNQPVDCKSSTRTVNHESNLLSCEISLPSLCCDLADDSFMSQFEILSLNHQPYFGTYVCYRLALETIDRSKEMRSSIILNILSIISQYNWVPWLQLTPFSTSAGQAWQKKGRFQTYEWTILVNVSGHGNLLENIKDILVKNSCQFIFHLFFCLPARESQSVVTSSKNINRHIPRNSK